MTRRGGQPKYSLPYSNLQKQQRQRQQQAFQYHCACAQQDQATHNQHMRSPLHTTTHPYGAIFSHECGLWGLMYMLLALVYVTPLEVYGATGHPCVDCTSTLSHLALT